VTSKTTYFIIQKRPCANTKIELKQDLPNHISKETDSESSYPNFHLQKNGCTFSNLYPNYTFISTTPPSFIAVKTFVSSSPKTKHPLYNFKPKSSQNTTVLTIHFPQFLLPITTSVLITSKTISNIFKILMTSQDLLNRKRKIFIKTSRNHGNPLRSKLYKQNILFYNLSDRFKARNNLIYLSISPFLYTSRKQDMKNTINSVKNNLSHISKIHNFTNNILNNNLTTLLNKGTSFIPNFYNSNKVNIKNNYITLFFLQESFSALNKVILHEDYDDSYNFKVSSNLRENRTDLHLTNIPYAD